ncbi:transglycosylase SLT domain-containing protein [Fluviispira sanaruensis]|uniref:Uncharacterized protein n=1 Tax=Fluviispira sanaruensis TaxID=2493639 RepID=A0A4P2VIS6_FLUSA|nr:transglycosylase SLT domain-containing protein [Fluviispira sanaruensis]BBH52996.1 hypothetical protein JCM31447_14390 [Fluviispira sanaruensis]
MKLFFIIFSILLSFSSLAIPLKRKDIRASRQLTKEQVANTLERAGFPREIVPVVTCIAEFESNFNPKAINKHNTNNTKDHGLFQINDIWMAKCKMSAKDLQNPFMNARCAFKVYQQQGLTAWVTYKKFKRTCLSYQIPNYSTTHLADVIVQNNQLM